MENEQAILEGYFREFLYPIAVSLVLKWAEERRSEVRKLQERVAELEAALRDAKPKPFVHNPWCNPGGICVCAEHLPTCHTLTLSEWQPCNCRDAR